jgi:hypothetical protein
MNGCVKATCSARGRSRSPRRARAPSRYRAAPRGARPSRARPIHGEERTATARSARSRRCSPRCAEDLEIGSVRRIGVDAEAGRPLLCGAEHSAAKVAAGSQQRGPESRAPAARRFAAAAGSEPSLDSTAARSSASSVEEELPALLELFVHAMTRCLPRQVSARLRSARRVRDLPFPRDAEDRATSCRSCPQCAGSRRRAAPREVLHCRTRSPIQRSSRPRRVGRRAGAARHRVGSSPRGLLSHPIDSAAMREHPGRPRASSPIERVGAPRARRRPPARRPQRRRVAGRAGTPKTVERVVDRVRASRRPPRSAARAGRRWPLRARLPRRRG